MAYANLVAQSCSTHQEKFQRFRDYLCSRNGTYDYSGDGLGWTLHDSVYAVDEDNLTDGDYFVVYSAGESGDEDMYIKFWYETTTTWMRTCGYLYWDNSAHTGNLYYGTVTGYGMCTLGTASYSISIYGDLDSFALINEYGTTVTTQMYCFGKTENPMYDDTVATAAGALTAGSDVSIALDAVPSTWNVGQGFMIRDTVDGEKAFIKTIDGNTITADLDNSYLAGSKSALDLIYLIPATSAPAVFYGPGSHDQGQAWGAANCYVSGGAVMSPVGGCVPDTMNQEYLASAITLHDTAPDGYFGTMRNVFITGANGKVHKDVLTAMDGTEYRYWKVGNYHYVVLEA